MEDVVIVVKMAGGRRDAGLEEFGGAIEGETHLEAGRRSRTLEPHDVDPRRIPVGIRRQRVRGGLARGDRAEAHECHKQNRANEPPVHVRLKNDLGQTSRGYQSDRSFIMGRHAVRWLRPGAHGLVPP